MTAIGMPAAALLAALVLGPCSGSELAGPVEQDPTASDFASLVNAVRVDAGCKELQWHSGAAEVARRHSADMKANGFFSHTNRDGESPFDRLHDAGITFRGAAENILSGEATATRALALWMNSPGHRANILECAFTHHGVGRVGDYWTHVFLTDPTHS